jgi:hypothetical protein
VLKYSAFLAKGGDQHCADRFRKIALCLDAHQRNLHASAMAAVRALLAFAITTATDLCSVFSRLVKGSKNQRPRAPRLRCDILLFVARSALLIDSFMHPSL